MKGSNEMILNQATMIEAVQMWLDSQMMPGKSPQVSTVKANGTSSYEGTQFAVSLTDREQAV